MTSMCIYINSTLIVTKVTIIFVIYYTQTHICIYVSECVYVCTAMNPEGKPRQNERAPFLPPAIHYIVCRHIHFGPLYSYIFLPFLFLTHPLPPLLSFPHFLSLAFSLSTRNNVNYMRQNINRFPFE